MIDPWNIVGLLRDLAARGRHPAVFAFGDDGSATRDSETLAGLALSAIGRLQDSGLGRCTGAHP